MTKGVEFFLQQVKREGGGEEKNVEHLGSLFFNLIEYMEHNTMNKKDRKLLKDFFETEKITYKNAKESFMQHSIVLGV